MHVKLDRDRCEGYGFCAETAPELFQLDDDGDLHLLMPAVPPELEAKAEQAVHVCPVAALALARQQEGE